MTPFSAAAGKVATLLLAFADTRESLADACRASKASMVLSKPPCFSWSSRGRESSWHLANISKPPRPRGAGAGDELVDTEATPHVAGEMADTASLCTGVTWKRSDVFSQVW